MISKALAIRALRGETYFRWRGGAVSRIEGLSDAVIALAMTLLIVSLEVPANFHELIASFRQLPAFAICFAMLVMCWYYHYQFHRRFGLESFYTIILNAILLFLVLFYVYPLKFVFTRLVDSLVFGVDVLGEVESTVMLFYSSGFIGIFLLFALMHLYAYKKRELLELTPIECTLTRGTIRAHLLYVAIGVVSLLLALFGYAAMAGVVYISIGPIQAVNGFRTGSKVEKMYNAGEA